ncbi:MAG: flagellar hook-basal body complex protein [Thermodesulfobacteriota bacterium]|nr:flagellar hook-basal body complex protein [Thermodesulfobacteriota bacterium]
MSLSSSLYTGTSGLTNMGNAMQVVGNNISNVNTVGFKKGRSTFADTLSESIATQAGADQVGRGMAMGSVDQSFGQGSFESTSNSTDLSIGGDGFFVMRWSDSEEMYYTRAGNFRFDKAGQLVNPQGYIVQGWEIDSKTGDDTGAIKDIVLGAFSSPPKKSEEITVITNLEASAESKAVVLSNLWDASAEEYIEAGKYNYQTSVKVYDSLGSTHDITIHYDKKKDTEWEYTITCNPEEDKRDLVRGTTSQGLLARGTITYSQDNGNIVNFTMSKMTGRIGNVQNQGLNTADTTHFTVENLDAMELDGYNFNFEFNGTEWEWKDIDEDGTNGDIDDLPVNYKSAEILYSDAENIEIALNGEDKNADLKIKLDEAAGSTEALSFDVSSKDKLHVQGLTNNFYTGDTANGNSSFEINAPGVMTVDSKDVGMTWYPQEEKWRWSNPEVAKDNGTLISGMNYSNFVAVDPDEGGDGTWDFTNNPEKPYSDPADEIRVTDASVMTKYSNIQVQYGDPGTGNQWNWDTPVKDADFTALATPSWAAPFDSPSLSGIDNGITSGNAFDAAGSYQLTYTNGTPSTWTSTGATAAAIVSGDDSGVTFELANGTQSMYSFGSKLGADQDGGTIEFTITPSAPEQYPDADLKTGSVAGTDLDDMMIDFNGDATDDLTFDMAEGVFSPGETFVFNVDPDAPPAEYASATLKGDSESATIDLDGSASDATDDDIVFNFDEALTSGPSSDSYADRSEIKFDIEGSAAWEEIPKDTIKKDGVYSFSADFLGGDNDSTKMDIVFDIGTRFDGTSWINDSMSSTQFAKSSSTTFQTADGYSSGDLQEVDVSLDGVMTGIFSNGESTPLFRVGLAKFFNNQGLSNSGSNLFRETTDSGEAITNRPGDNGLGTISSNSLEMSNVDISEEFVKMISTQRGFQANSKTITTTDDMMSTVIQMKR